MMNDRIEADSHETARLERLRRRLTPLKDALLGHPVYREINSLAALRLFMEHHAFAVWDFMSLLKALQARLCCVGVPWLPAADPQATRFLNEIVLAEESDEDGQGGYLSHFGLYLRAMTRCRADTGNIEKFLGEIRKGCPVPAALAAVGVPGCVGCFVRQTFDLIERGSLWSLASAFTFGREGRFPEAGEDVKVMGVRRDRELTLTVALAFVDRFIADTRSYFHRKEEMQVALTEYLTGRLHALDRVAVQLNTLDDPARGEAGMYLTVLGTSAEGGDCGQVGRGNWVNGVMPLNRPISSEAAAGKNPVSHVGKIYTLLTHHIARQVVERVQGVVEVYVWLCSQIGRPINNP